MAISKVCSAYEIGPASELSIPFDIIVYNDCIEFYQEECVWAPDSSCLQSFLSSDLKNCLHQLHHLHIVHRDIKPSNLLWC